MSLATPSRRFTAGTMAAGSGLATAVASLAADYQQADPFAVYPGDGSSAAPVAGDVTASSGHRFTLAQGEATSFEGAGLRAFGR